jgi:N-acetylglucosamine malate deacetylase 1
MAKKILVVAAHADDEALGAAGTLARHVALGDTVHILFLTDGVGARNDGADKTVRESASVKAAAALRIDKANIRNADFPDNAMDSVALIEIVRAVEKAVAEIRPDTIYTHHHGDLNVDHRVAHNAVMTACRPLPGASVREIYGMEVLSSTEWATGGAANAFLPTRHVDISKYFDAKMKALKAYDLEMRPFPHSRSYEAVEALAKLRGANVGIAYAESFTVLRQIVD